MSGQLVEQWPLKPLSEICEIRPAKSEVKGKFESTEHVSFVPMKDLGIGQMNIEHSETREFGKVYPNYTYFADDDVLLAKITPCFENGKLGIAQNLVNGIGFGSSEYFVFRPNKDVCKEWIYYFLSQKQFRLEGSKQMTGAVGHKRVSKDFIANYKIPSPPLEEQQRIVSILDEAFRNISHSKQQVELKAESGSELLQSIVKSVFSETGDGWIDTTLGDISEIIMGQSPKGDSYNTEGFGVPLINGPVEFGPNPFSKTLKTKFTTAQTKMCEVNDLILCVRGSTTGRMNIAGYESCIGRGVAAIRSNEYQDWVNHFINFNRNHIYSLGTGATFPNISKDLITKIRIQIPPDNERKLLVSKLQNISFEVDLLDSKITQELNSLEELKQSILQEAFNGTL